MNGAIMLLPGAVFGVGLIVSGLTNPAKVFGVLDFTGQWDPTLFVVMGAAVATFAPLNYWIRKKRTHSLDGTPIPKSSASRITPRLLVGASIFGLGWGLGGICPGPALTALGTGQAELLIFIPAMVVGMLVAQRGFGADQSEPATSQAPSPS